MSWWIWVMIVMNLIYCILMLALLIWGWRASKGYRLLRKRMRRDERRIRGLNRESK